MTKKKCFECTKPAQVDHHVIPQSKGGEKTIPLCYKCHEKVHDHHSANVRKLTKDALAKRKALGIPLGRKKGTIMPKVLDARRDELVVLLEKGLSLRHASRELEVHHSTVSTYVKNNPDLIESKERGKTFVRNSYKKPNTSLDRMIATLDEDKVIADLRSGMTYPKIASKYSVPLAALKNYVSKCILK